LTEQDSHGALGLRLTHCELSPPKLGEIWAGSQQWLSNAALAGVWTVKSEQKMYWNTQIRTKQYWRPSQTHSYWKGKERKGRVFI